MESSLDHILNPAGYRKERRKSFTQLWQLTKRSSEGNSNSWLHWRNSKKEPVTPTTLQTEVNNKRASMATAPVIRDKQSRRHTMMNELCPSPIPLEVMVTNYAQASQYRSSTYDGGYKIKYEPSDELTKLFAEVLPVANFLKHNELNANNEEKLPEVVPTLDSMEFSTVEYDFSILNENSQCKSSTYLPTPPAIDEPLSCNQQMMLWLIFLGCFNYLIGLANISFLWNLFIIIPVYNQLDYYQRQERLAWELKPENHQLKNNEWLNHMITHLWCKLPQDYLTQKLISALNSLSDFPTLSVHNLNMGNKNSIITDITVFSTDPHEDIIGELSFNFMSGTSPPQCKIQFPFSANNYTLNIPCQVHLRSMRGTFKFQLLAPHYRVLNITFQSLPTTDWNIYPLNVGDMMRFPIISQLIKDQINAIMSATIVHPQTISIDLNFSSLTVTD